MNKPHKPRDMMSNRAFATMWIVGFFGIIAFCLGIQGLLRWWLA